MRYVCKQRSSDEVVWSINADSHKEAVKYFAQLKQLKQPEFLKTFKVEEEKYER